MLSGVCLLLDIGVLCLLSHFSEAQAAERAFSRAHAFGHPIPRPITYKRLLSNVMARFCPLQAGWHVLTMEF